jgi:hypothetical protein
LLNGIAKVNAINIRCSLSVGWGEADTCNYNIKSNAVILPRL